MATPCMLDSKGFKCSFNVKVTNNTGRSKDFSLGTHFQNIVRPKKKKTRKKKNRPTKPQNTANPLKKGQKVLHDHVAVAMPNGRIDFLYSGELNSFSCKLIVDCIVLPSNMAATI